MYVSIGAPETGIHLKRIESSVPQQVHPSKPDERVRPLHAPGFGSSNHATPVQRERNRSVPQTVAARPSGARSPPAPLAHLRRPQFLNRANNSADIVLPNDIAAGCIPQPFCNLRLLVAEK